MLKNRGRLFETKIIKSIASGKMWFNKGDANTIKNCIEIKYTDKKGFRITTKILEKIWGEALNQNKEPILVIGIKRNDNEIFVLNCSIQLEKNL